jgi:hypothetical protein
MKYIKLFEGFINEGHIGADTSWTDEYNGQEVTLSLQDVNDYLDKNNVDIEEIDPKQFEHLLIKTERDPQRVAKADLNFPIIITKNNGKYTKILDGQHRLVKAITNKIPTIKAKILDLDKAPNNYKHIFR